MFDFLNLERKKSKNGFVFGKSGVGKGVHPWDWETIAMPETKVEFVMDYELSMSDIEILRQGFLPKEMEDKWFVYCQADTLYFHRSWTGFCIYIVEICESHETLRVTANRDPEQYAETTIEGDKINLAILLNSLLDKPYEELREQYIKHIRNLILKGEE